MTYLVNASSGATAEYEGLAFTSFYRDADGRVYGTAADGIYELAGETDAGAPIEAVLVPGMLDFGSAELKHLPNVYVGAKSSDKLVLRVNGYAYDARHYDDALKVQRFDIGKGLRANYWQLELYNTSGSDFEISMLSAAAAPTSRRI